MPLIHTPTLTIPSPPWSNEGCHSGSLGTCLGRGRRKPQMAIRGSLAPSLQPTGSKALSRDLEGGCNGLTPHRYRPRARQGRVDPSIKSEALFFIIQIRCRRLPAHEAGCCSFTTRRAFNGEVPFAAPTVVEFLTRMVILPKASRSSASVGTRSNTATRTQVTVTTFK